MNKTKACTKCKVEYPATSEYWHRKKDSKDGFNTQCKVCRNEQNKQWYEDNREQKKDYLRVYYQDNKEKIKDYNRAYYQDNKEQLDDYSRAYRQDNKERVRKWRRRSKQIRKAKKHKLPHTFTTQEWEETKQIFNNSCAYCGMTKEEHRQEYNQILHQDHFIPLSKGGGYTKENIIPACRSCNASKKDTDFEEWYPQQEYYSKEREQKILDYMGGFIYE